MSGCRAKSKIKGANGYADYGRTSFYLSPEGIAIFTQNGANVGCASKHADGWRGWPLGLGLSFSGLAGGSMYETTRFAPAIPPWGGGFFGKIRPRIRDPSRIP